MSSMQGPEGVRGVRGEEHASSSVPQPSAHRPLGGSSPQRPTLSASSSATTIVHTPKPIILVPGFLGPGAPSSCSMSQHHKRSPAHSFGSSTPEIPGSSVPSSPGPSDHQPYGCSATPDQLRAGLLGLEALRDHEGQGGQRAAEGGAEGLDTPWHQYWGEAVKLSTEDSMVLCAWPSGLGSLWDRACEMFFQIKGGTVDFGQEHSERYGHSRFGRTYPGLFPEWSATNPVHLVGHSLGGTTIRVLQHLLGTNAFEGYETSADWVLSITTINAPHNGSLTAYALGEKEAAAPQVVKLSPGHVLGSVVHTLCFLNLKPLGYDFSLDHWNLSFRETSWIGGMMLLLRSVLWKSELVEDEDNAAYDASIHSMREWNKKIGEAHSQTYYLSLVGDASDANTFNPEPMGPGLKGFAAYLLIVVQWVFRRVFLTLLEWLTFRRDYAELKKALPEVDLRDYKGPSDGLCTVFSQQFPSIGLETPCESANMPDNVDQMRPGVWYVSRHGEDHMGIVPLSPSSSAQHRFFRQLFAKLRQLQQPICPEPMDFKVVHASYSIPAPRTGI